MANNSANLTSLDFDTLKSNLKTYLSTQSVFKDYNFEGSNMNVLLDVLAYNTYLNSFYLNMVASEMFLDSAQKLDTVVSHAKELNYTPRSARSSVANVDITLSANGITTPLIIPRGTIFSGTNANGTYNFVTRTRTTHSSPNTVYEITDLQIYEGLYVNNSFIVNSSDETQRFVLNNQNIDTDSLIVTVYEDNFASNGVYTKADTLFGLDNHSNVYFIQACENNQYEILFGDGFLGYRPKNESLIVAEYMVNNGKDAEGVSTFSMDTDLGNSNGGQVTVDTITTVSNSSSGSNIEEIESIRFYAPRYFATQQRAVASDDYKSLVLSKFGGTLADVNVYGGETLETKLYGRVVVCLKSSSGSVVPDYIKKQVSNYLLDYISVPTRVVIRDPDQFYLKVDTTVTYDKTSTTILSNDIKNYVLDAIDTYNTDNLGTFNDDFRYSKFIAAIDDAYSSITSNQTDIQLIKRISPKANYPTTYNINFGNEAYNQTYYTDAVINSSYFTYVDEEGTNYVLCRLKDDNEGNIIVYTYINNIYTVLNSSLGTVNYTTGTVVLTRLNVSDYSNYISIYFKPMNKDILVENSMIVEVDLNDVSITVTESN